MQFLMRSFDISGCQYKVAHEIAHKLVTSSDFGDGSSLSELIRL